MRDGNVYVVQALGLGWVKIGWAVDVARRMVEVASTCGYDLTLLGAAPGTQGDESRLLRSFEHMRIAYDWFAPGEDLLAHAESFRSLLRISLVSSTKRTRPYLFGRLSSASSGRRGPLFHLTRPNKAAARPTGT